MFVARSAQAQAPLPIASQRTKSELGGADESQARISAATCAKLALALAGDVQDIVEVDQFVSWPFLHAATNLRLMEQVARSWTACANSLQPGEASSPSPTGPTPGLSIGPMQLAEPSAANKPTPVLVEPMLAATVPALANISHHMRPGGGTVTSRSGSSTEQFEGQHGQPSAAYTFETLGMVPRRL